MAIYFEKETKTFYLEGKSTTYAFFINNFGYAEHLYYGERIHRDYILFTRMGNANSCTATLPGTDNTKGIHSYQNMNPELSFFGTGDYREPTVHPRFVSGDRLTELHYRSHEILDEKPKISGMPSLDGGKTLVLHLYDEIKDLGADLYYTVYDDCDVIARRIVYINNSDEVIKLDRAYSFAMSLPRGDYDMLSLFGNWASERQVERVAIHHGVSSVDSKRASSSATLNPFIAVMERDATEVSGKVWGFNLVYSSSYVLKAERTSADELLITGGINDFDFEWTLESGESFETPEAVIAFSADGIGGMSREYHDAYRNHLINKRYVKKSRPLLINNWEATYFDFTTEKLCAIADAVRGTGIDTLVLDDGWFGKRDNDRSGLGDWVVNEEKLKGGLRAVIDYVHSCGMKFGLWFEPEMISEDSDIFRAHPEYAVGAPDRKRCYSRHQYMMDLTNPEVRDYIVNSVNAVLDEYEIDYVKWDFNRNATEFFGAKISPERMSEFAHRYALGLYDIFERIVERNPDVFFEGCASGGARFDPAILHYFPQIWTSDNSDAEDRTYIQYGTSIVYPLSAMSCHVSAVPNHQTGRTADFDTRGHIAHLGATGYELDTTVFTDEDRAAVKAQTEEYKRMENLILEGDLYRLDDRYSSNFFSFAVVSKDKSQAYLTCYRSLHHCTHPTHRVIMQGLDKSREYYIPELKIIVHGSTLCSVGIPVSFGKKDFATKVFHFEEK
ncbi:MAG: alpha-galactosidase [Clostridia bacterium]|nr:alpha-galactosidase [Clostridia bacterium]